jgi:cardiolipin synthase (CMP-forming)
VNLPNLITLARLLSVPVAIWLVLSDEYAAAFWLFIAAGLSDAIDGFIARRFDQRSSLGALLDPAADKALLVSMYGTLGIAGHLPNWLVILVVFRDVMIVGGFMLSKILAQPVRHNPIIISKINTALQIVLAGVQLARLGFGATGFSPIVQVLIYTVAATTILSGTAYLVRWAKTLAGMEAAP